ncbi:MAG: shikimate dehydrogenase [Polyangiaceae bacterium]|nr:shikimate dehydrogenase [Polyangiaceae bacterium]MCW5789804.1 shikimate dehydrogenase [Polyangiaceae bacterium]
MHHAGYRALGLAYHYHPFSIVEAQLASALSGMRALGIRGLGISMPFKLSVMPLLDAIDPLAQAIGAVNTIVNQGGRLIGHNTDAYGAVTALAERTTLSGARVLLLGAGGAARAVAFGVVEAGSRLTIANRDAAKAAELASQLMRSELLTTSQARKSDLATESGRTFKSAQLTQAERSGVPKAERGEARGGGVSTHGDETQAEHGARGEARSLPLAALKVSDYDVLVNATSVGMDATPGCPLAVDELSPSQLVMDIVYKPLRTELVAACEARGVPVIHGGRMLLHQAARQFQLYTGQAAPLTAMDAALSPFLT